MSTLRSALTLTSIAFMIGIGVVLVSIQYRHLGVSVDNRPVIASDDMARAASATRPTRIRLRPVRSTSL